MIRLSSAPAGVTRISVTGEIDMDSADELAAALRAGAERGGTRTLVVDFAGVTFCDSSGIRVLDEAYAMAARRRIALQLVEVQPQVRRVLEIVGMTALLAHS
ncbi:STAS domain-containing protein [Actinoplanes sp. NPDC023936]|uniref:STAS domain-containing protein n=1 Tax=Actinoplanes sp. NPDC023936 TaxID=3154910 RepID=UPI0033FFAD1A